MPDTSPRLRGGDLRRLRREHKLKIAELARRMDVDPRTVTRWETAPYVPDKVVPALQGIFNNLGTPEPAASPDSDDAGPRLHEATHVELLAELARRIAAAPNTERQLPPVPQVSLTWSRSVGPSAHRYDGSGETSEEHGTSS